MLLLGLPDCVLVAAVLSHVRDLDAFWPAATCKHLHALLSPRRDADGVHVTSTLSSFARLRWAVQAGGYEPHEWTCAVAALKGMLNALRWLHRVRGCPWNTLVFTFAVRGGHLRVLEWLRSVRAPCHPLSLAHAGLCGHVHVLAWAEAHRVPWRSTELCIFAAANGHVDVLQYAHEQACHLLPEILAHAGFGGHVRVFAWAEARGLPWRCTELCTFAAAHGHLDVLQYAHERGCPYEAAVRRKVVRMLLRKWRRLVRAHAVVAYWRAAAARRQP